MFRGQYHHSIDAKGRVSLPARFRDQIAAEGDQRVVILPWPFDACLRMYTLAAWERFELKVAALSTVEAKAMKFRRLMSAAVDCEIDRAGRVLLPAHLREHAHLADEALCLGLGEFLEIWAKRDFATSLQMDAKENQELQAAMEQFGL